MTNFRKWFKGEYPGGHTSGYYFAHKAWQYRQQEIDQLKAQLNNMEACYIENKKELEDQQKRINETITQVNKYRNIGLPMLNPLLDDIEKALRGANDLLTDARQKAEDQINNGARLTKHQIDL